MKLKGQVSIVTGAASGIGRAIAHRFAREGADVIVNDIDLEGSNNVVDEIKAFNGGRAMAIQADVTNSTKVNEMVKRTLDEFGKVDILICNAGGNAARLGGKGPFEKTTNEGLAAVTDLNLKSVLICSHAVVEHMIQRGSGKIVSIASMCGMIGCKESVAYSAAKAGIIGFTMALAKELGPHGITVNCVSPGCILSPPNLANPVHQELMKRDSWLHRLEQPKVVADAVAFLVSDEGLFITGQNLAVDGGRSLGW